MGRSVSNVIHGTTPLASVPPELAAKENHQEQVISPLTQSAQRFPFYARDSIMTPRCRKPVFTFSPIDEPNDELVPHNSDALQLANMNLMQPQTSAAPAAAPAVDIPDDETQNETGQEDSESCETPVQDETSPVQDETCPADGTCLADEDTLPVHDGVVSHIDDEADPVQEDDICPIDDDSCLKEEISTSDSSTDDEEDTSSSSAISGCAPIQQESRDDSLTSPFKSYLIGREIQVFNGSVQEEEVEEDEQEELEGDNDDGVTELSASDVSSLDAENPISQSLLEFLDGTAPAASSCSSDGTSPSSPTARPSPPLTKSILFETSL